MENKSEERNNKKVKQSNNKQKRTQKQNKNVVFNIYLVLNSY